MVVGLWQWILVCFVVDYGSMVVRLDFVRIPPLAADPHSLFSSSLSLQFLTLVNPSRGFHRVQCGFRF